MREIATLSLLLGTLACSESNAPVVDDAGSAEDAATDARTEMDAGTDAYEPGPCSASTRCPVGEYCVYATGTCGRGGEMGQCAPLSHSRDGSLRPTVGCNGACYGNPSFADYYGVGVDTEASCTGSDDGRLFPCGETECSVSGGYCLDADDGATCGELPIGGGYHGCDAFTDADDPCAGATRTCETRDGGLHVRCE